MKRTELLEIRKMCFEEAWLGWHSGRLSQEEAARLLGVCERTFRRYLNRYREEGLEGLIDRRLMQVSHRRAPVDEVMRVTARYRKRDAGLDCKALLCLVPQGWRAAQGMKSNRNNRFLETSSSHPQALLMPGGIDTPTPAQPCHWNKTSFFLPCAHRPLSRAAQHS